MQTSWHFAMVQSSHRPGRIGRQALRTWMQRSGLSQNELAAQLGISRPYMCQVFSGARRPGLDILVRMEGLTGIPTRSWSDIAEAGLGHDAIVGGIRR